MGPVERVRPNAGLPAATAKPHDPTLATRDVAEVARTGVAVVDPFAARP
jgi:predicted nucleic acid-binding protein